jgi:hypothetical protein
MMNPSSQSARQEPSLSRRMLAGALLLCCLLASCASNTSSIAARPDAAIILSYSLRETTNNGWFSCTPVMANGQRVVRDWFMESDTTVAVAPGGLLLVVDVRFLDALASVGPQQAMVGLHTQVEAGHVYRIVGRRQDENVVVWLEDTRTGEAQSQQAKAMYGRHSPDRGMYPVIPVLPAK